ncbi:MAG TPA: hypothetical protein VK983_04860 [Candidatus Limnocylindrales bacterium]|nr:hypothetical protein [Candidatus Limnocylindrales bacterium]
MAKNQNQLLTKGVFAVAIVAIAGIVGGVNFANAQSANRASKPSKEQCAAAGFQNYGQCVRQWAQDRQGYGRQG